MARDERRLYKELAWLWPVFSPPREYVEETELFTRVIRRYIGRGKAGLLHLGCGGGHNDFTFKRHFQVTGLDVSPAMLGLARKLNPEARYVRGDMRTASLGRTFDAVYIGDSVAYMLSEKDLERAFRTAYRHLRPGGIMLVVAEFTKENFLRNWSGVETKSGRGIELTVLENYYDPDPADTTFEATFVYLVRKRKKLSVHTDRHLSGVMPVSAWKRALVRAGFTVRRHRFTDSAFEPGESMPMFAGIKPRNGRER